MVFRFATICLTLALFTGNVMAAPSAAERTAIERAYAAKLNADTAADIAQRIAARWRQLANDPAAPTIGKFFDYTCPYCKAVEPRLEALLKSDPKVRLVLKEFPILAPESMTAARA